MTLRAGAFKHRHWDGGKGLYLTPDERDSLAAVGRRIQTAPFTARFCCQFRCRLIPAQRYGQFLVSQLDEPNVIVPVAERNESAHRFFDRAGFRRTMIEMTRELSDSD